MEPTEFTALLGDLAAETEVVTAMLTAGAEDQVTGPALDFCLVVTRRRHLDDTALHVTGPVAKQWMGIAQAFGRPPSPGREAGANG
jgi:hypothetical protein